MKRWKNGLCNSVPSSTPCVAVDRFAIPLSCSGVTGTGKTMLSSHFVTKTKGKKDRALLIAFAESRARLGQNASGWGIDFKKL